MSGRTIYLFGYSRRRPAFLLDAATRLDAVVWDIRFSPRSRRAQWSGKNLAALLGDRYVWRVEMGNLLYRSKADVELNDPEAALPMFDAESRPVILLCVCPVSASCHRSVAASFIAERRVVTVRELDAALAALEPRQASLFGEADR